MAAWTFGASQATANASNSLYADKAKNKITLLSLKHSHKQEEHAKKNKEKRRNNEHKMQRCNNATNGHFTDRLPLVHLLGVFSTEDIRAERSNKGECVLLCCLLLGIGNRASLQRHDSLWRRRLRTAENSSKNKIRSSSHDQEAACHRRGANITDSSL
jgi:hypothetical protein